MAQLMIDTDTESVAGLMLLSRLLTDYANMRAVANKALADSYPIVDFKSPPGDTSKQADLYAKAVAAYTNSEPDPTKLFGKFPVPVPTGANANVVPLFPQPVPLNLPGAASVMGLAVSTATPALNAPTVMAPTLPTNAPSLPAAFATGLSANAPPLTTQAITQTGAISVTEVDSQGLPWDARIHSSSKKKKGDGTWILKRGVDHTLAQTVTAELMTAKLSAHQTNVPTAPVALPSQLVPLVGGASVVANAANLPVTLPPALSPVPVFPGTPVMLGAAPGAAITANAVPVSGLPAVGTVPVAPIDPVKRFREMMGKISAALGAKTITQQQLTDAHRGVGLEQLQQAVLFSDKIPDIEQALGL